MTVLNAGAIYQVHPPLLPALKDCMETFDGAVALYSNSAGLYQFDPDGEDSASIIAISPFSDASFIQIKDASCTSSAMALYVRFPRSYISASAQKHHPSSSRQQSLMHEVQ